jgi:hypothetical protein
LICNHRGEGEARISLAARSLSYLKDWIVRRVAGAPVTGSSAPGPPLVEARGELLARAFNPATPLTMRHEGNADDRAKAGNRQDSGRRPTKAVRRALPGQVDGRPSRAWRPAGEPPVNRHAQECQFLH